MSASLSVILPAFNEAANIEDNLVRLLRCLEASDRAFEILVVDDGSTDATGACAQNVASADERVKLLTLPKNRGKGRALAKGCERAGGDVLVLLDADLAIPPEEIVPIVERLERSRADVAVGSKYESDALHWPLHRRMLSRLYHVVTAVLFRLPLRDTQTGLKALRVEAARHVLPHLRSRRFAWDVELLLLAHKARHRFVIHPVRVEPASRASRVGVAGALHAAVDTLRIFGRDVGLASYARVRSRHRPPRETRVIVSADDLGMSASVDAGIATGVACGALTSVSALATGATIDAALPASADADLGLHLDLLEDRSLTSFLVRACFGRPGRRALRRAVQAQLASLRALGAQVTHLDAHRHAYLLPWTRRDVLGAAARSRVGAVRSLRPLGSLRGPTVMETLKRLAMWIAATASRGAEHARGLRAPDGYVDVHEARRWVEAGRVPRFARGRTIEVIAHPAAGPSDLPAREQGEIDRAADARALYDPPLTEGLAALGCRVVDFAAL